DIRDSCDRGESSAIHAAPTPPANRSMLRAARSAVRLPLPAGLRVRTTHPPIVHSPLHSRSDRESARGLRGWKAMPSPFVAATKRAPLPPLVSKSRLALAI